jgi:CrcB protein
LPQKLGLLAVAGAVGTLARFGLQALVQRGRPGFPYGTLAVNLLGCLLFGLVWALGEGRQVLAPSARQVVLVGFMGSFTTFSSFAFETTLLLEAGEIALAAANVVVSNAAGFLALVAGIGLGRRLGG